MINKYIIKYYNINDVKIGGSGSSDDNEIPCPSLYNKFFILTLQDIIKQFISNNGIISITAENVTDEFKVYKHINKKIFMSCIRGYAFSINIQTNHVTFINNQQKHEIMETNIKNNSTISGNYETILTAYKDYSENILQSYTKCDNKSISNEISKTGDLINKILIRVVNTIDKIINSDTDKCIYDKIDKININETVTYNQIIEKISPLIDNFKIIDKDYTSKSPDCIIELWLHKQNKNIIIRIINL